MSRYIMKNHNCPDTGLIHYLIWIDGVKWHWLASPADAVRRAAAHDLDPISPARALALGLLP